MKVVKKLKQRRIIPGKTRIAHIRFPERLWERFGLVCEANDTSPSEMLRELMRILVREEAGTVREWQEQKRREAE